jgi:hypothetical protein
VTGRAGRWPGIDARRVAERTALGLALVSAVVVIAVGLSNPLGLLVQAKGVDYSTYMDAAREWLAGRGFYLDYQLTGPYVVVATERLYPPTILPLLAVFTVLPAVLWWVIPAAIVVGIVLYWRPSTLAWAGILACLAVPSTLELWATGNPGIWAAAAVAAGTRWGWPGVLVLLKPSLFPFAIVSIRSRGWWVAAAGFAFVSLAFLPMWGDYAAALVNARGPRVSLLYSLGNVPLLLIPLVAWLARRQPA